MKIMVRDTDTGLLYCSPGEWVESWIQATDFKDLETAWGFVKTLEKSHLEVFVVSEDGRPMWGQRIE
jgi:hypothetical protein